MNTKAQQIQLLIESSFKDSTLEAPWEFIAPIEDEVTTITYAATEKNIHAVVSVSESFLTMTCKLISLGYSVLYYSHKKISTPDAEAEINKELIRLKNAFEFQTLAP